MESTYTDLLKYFNTYTFYDDTLHTRSYVTMDNIHDSILIIGLNMDKPLKYYIIKAKQLAINDHNASNRQYRILVENFKRIVGVDFEFDILNDYGFTEIELDLVLELLEGIKAYKSSIPRRTYQKTLTSIKTKIKQSII